MTAEKAEGSGTAPEPGNLEAVFSPRSVAIVGASDNPHSQGYHYVRYLLDYGYRGAIYPVNPRLATVLGLTCYPSLTAVPEPVDYVISCIPAALTLDLVDECAAKGVRVIHFFTARFSETGRREAALMEEKLRRRTRAAGIRVIGPNCMGIYYPKVGLSFRSNLPKEPGAVAFFSQSGGNAGELAYHASLRGVRFSKVVSYGNALDLNEADFLNYFTSDPESRIIAGYIEGVRDGRRFFRALRQAAATKPVIILKAGRTQAGTRAVASHTAALAGAQAVWATALRQAGAVAVRSLEEMIDMMLAFLFLTPAAGLRVGVVGGGGGRSVLSADECEEAGLTVVPLPTNIRQTLKAQAPTIWDWVSNPVDGSILGGSGLSGDQLLELMAASPEFDALIANAGEDWVLDRPEGCDALRRTVEGFIRVAAKTTKPLAVVLGSADTAEEWRWSVLIEVRERLIAAGIPVYPTIGRAARAVSRFVHYHLSRQEEAATTSRAAASLMPRQED